MALERLVQEPCLRCGETEDLGLKDGKKKKKNKNWVSHQHSGLKSKTANNNSGNENVRQVGRLSTEITDPCTPIIIMLHCHPTASNQKEHVEAIRGNYQDAIVW